jgi:hypothetical protein
MDIKQKLAPVLDKLELIRLDHLKPSPIAKAIVGFVAPAIVILGNAMLQGRAPSAAELWVAAGTALVTGFAVYATPNRPAV